MGRRYGSGKGERGKGKGQRAKGKGQRAKGKGFKYILYPLTFSQTTREVHTAYPNRIGGGGEMSFSPMPHALCPMPYAPCPITNCGFPQRMLSCL